MVSGITTVRMNMGLKKELFELKLIDREPYEDVIQRLVDYFKENIELSNETKKLVNQRIKQIAKGEVISTKELHEQIKKEKRGDKGGGKIW